MPYQPHPNPNYSADDPCDENTEKWVLTATILAASMAFINGSALNVALPAIQDALDATGTQVLWIVNGYTLMLAALILVGGALGDRLGRKRVYAVGIIIFTLSSIACGLTPSANFLIGARIVQGLGGALMIPGSLAIITATIHPDRRGKAIGTWSALTTIVTVAGPVLGGFLADAGLWRAVFLIVVPLAIVSLIALILRVPETYDNELEGGIDYPGAAAITIGLAGLTYGFTSAPEFGWGDPRIIGTLAAGVIGVVAFVIIEANTEHPMMPLKLFKSPTFAGTNLLTLFLYGALGVYSFLLTLNWVQVQGYSETVAGFAFAPFAIMLFLLSRWAGNLVDSIGPRIPLIIGPTLAGVGFVLTGLVGLTDGFSDYWTTYFPAILVFGIGMGITVAPLVTAVMGSVPTHNAGTASGVNNAISRTAGVLAVAILGAIALIQFSNVLEARAMDLPLSAEAEAQLIQNSEDLGNTAVPASVDEELVPEVERAIKLSFVETFRTSMFICGGLAFVSAIMAGILVENRMPNADAEEAEARAAT